MCGIAGIIRYDSAPGGGLRRQVGDGRPGDDREARLGAMMRRLRHRGPDGEGTWFDPCVALAHTRLALWDLELGVQPMTSPDGRYTLVYNGEVYNAPELRLELRHAWDFRTTSDTEVVLAACVLLGEACLLRLNGMFAFFLWDARLERGFAARDRLGVKPFVYRYTGGEMLFASEAKAILAAMPGSPRAHAESILEYLAAPWASGVDHSMFEEIDHLPAGHLLRVSREGLETACWWDFRMPAHLIEDEAALTPELRARLEAAVARALIADVPVGSFLSGGVDSTLIAALARKTLPAPPRCFTIRFEEQDRYDYSRSLIVTSDDTPFARAAASELALPLTLIPVDRRGLAGDLERLALIDDALPAWEQELAQHHLARVTSRHVKAVLVGDAADETHYGYHFLLDPEATRSPAGILRRFAQPPVRRDRLPDPIGHFEAKYLALTTRAGYRWDSRIEQMKATTYLIVKRWLGRLLLNGDLHTMAFSLEGRVPFADIELLELAMRVHPRLGFHEGVEKWMLRQAGKGAIPEAVRMRKKSALPKDQHVASIYQREAARLVEEAAEFLGAYLELEPIRALCRPDRPLVEQERALLFRVIGLAHWARHYGVRAA